MNKIPFSAGSVSGFPDNSTIGPNVVTAALIAVFPNYLTFGAPVTTQVLNAALTYSDNSIWTAELQIPTFPKLLKSSPAGTVAFGVNVTANVGECKTRAQNVTVTMTLCTTYLSGAGNGSIQLLTGDDIYSTATIPITVTNLPFENRVCKREHNRLYEESIIG